MGEKRHVYKIVVGKRKGERPLGKHRCRWEDNIRNDVRKIGWEGVDFIYLAQDRGKRRDLVNTIMNLLQKRRKLERNKIRLRNTATRQKQETDCSTG
jgi:hypothetical protein